jgi:hypothetical protein
MKFFGGLKNEEIAESLGLASSGHMPGLAVPPHQRGDLDLKKILI